MLSNRELSKRTDVGYKSTLIRTLITLFRLPLSNSFRFYGKETSFRKQHCFEHILCSGKPNWRQKKSKICSTLERNGEWGTQNKKKQVLSTIVLMLDVITS
jgi:hypothetical protein